VHPPAPSSTSLSYVYAETWIVFWWKNLMVLYLMIVMNSVIIYITYLYMVQLENFSAKKHFILNMQHTVQIHLWIILGWRITCRIISRFLNSTLGKMIRRYTRQPRKTITIYLDVCMFDRKRSISYRTGKERKRSLLLLLFNYYYSYTRYVFKNKFKII